MQTGWIRATLTTAVIVLAGCGSDGGGPLDDGGGVVIPPPNPDGVLLPGSPGDIAVTRTSLLPPSPVDPLDILDDLLLTRLEAAISPTATVGDVNDLMVRHDVRIVAMMANDPFVTLKTPRVSDEAEAQALADSLTADGVFAFATPAIQPSTGIVPEGKTIGGPDRVLPPSGDNRVDHLKAIHMPAAWNAMKLAQSNNKKLTVLLPDAYYSFEGHDEIDVLEFPSTVSGDATDAERNGWYPGNHGFHVAGIMAANFDDTKPTGTSPDPTRLLRVLALPGGGLSWNDQFIDLILHFPTTGNFVVSSSLQYGNLNKGLWANDRYGRALQALNWRHKTAAFKDRFVHATAAGNWAGQHPNDDAGDARWGSPWCIASAFGDLREAVPLDSIASVDSTRFEQKWAFALSIDPSTADARGNTIVVGSSGMNGAESSFSNRNSDVRVVGENVYGPCVEADPGSNPNGCDGLFAEYSGTSQATPQVAGLAAYLWSLNRAMDTSELVDAIATSFEGGLVNAFEAVMSLDASIASARVRKAVLDVAGATVIDPPDNIFNDVDIEKLLDEWDSRNGALDWSKYDINGDGHSGGGSTGTIDLDVSGDINTAEQFIEIGSRVFNETGVSDLDMLCYYAWSPLFVGNSQRRAELLAQCIPEPCPYVLVIARHDVGSSVEPCGVEKRIETSDYPLDLSSIGDCVSEGAEYTFSATCSTSYTDGSIRCYSQTTKIGTYNQAIANGTIEFDDSLTIINDALTGTQGQIQVAVRVDGSQQNSGTQTSTLFQIQFWANDQQGFQEYHPGGEVAFPTTYVTIPITFTYGRAFPVMFRLDNQARSAGSWTGWARSNISYSWFWIDGAAAGSKYSWCSNLNFGNLPGQQAAVDEYSAIRSREQVPRR